jgi:putative toxin-antitoxin system antitoxin component (TIGR02293 family)
MTLKLLSDKSRGIEVKSPSDYIHLSRKGLSVKQLSQILKFTGISTKEITGIISVSDRQLARYTDETILKRNISAHLIQIVELYKFGYEVFEDKAKFIAWMNSKIRALNYQSPIELLDTPFGIENVRTILGRIEHGVYS